jgi:hypothetical protein
MWSAFPIASDQIATGQYASPDPPLVVAARLRHCPAADRQLRGDIEVASWENLKKYGKRLGIAVVALVVMLGLQSLPTPLALATSGDIIAGSVSISGTATVGNNLTAVTGTWTPTPDSFTYQWLRDGGNISDATESTYTLVGEDYSAKVSVRITGNKAGYSSVSATTAQTAAVAAATFVVGTPVVYGSAFVGSSLYAEVGTWDPAPYAYGYQWLRDGTAISGATSEVFSLTSADLGHKLSVTVTGTRTGYVTASATSTQTAAVANPDAPTLSDFTAGSVVISSGTCVKIPLSVSYSFSPYLVSSVSKVTITAKVTNKNGKKIGTAVLAGSGPSLAGLRTLTGTATGTFTWCTGHYLGKVTFGPASGTWSGDLYRPTYAGTPVSGKITSKLTATARVRAGIRFGTPAITTSGTRKTLTTTFDAYRPERAVWSGLKKRSVVTIQKQVGSTWVKVKTVKIPRKGIVKATWTASASATYRVVWVGSGTKDRAVSATVIG